MHVRKQKLKSMMNFTNKQTKYIHVRDCSNWVWLCKTGSGTVYQNNQIQLLSSVEKSHLDVSLKVWLLDKTIPRGTGTGLLPEKRMNCGLKYHL